MESEKQQTLASTSKDVAKSEKKSQDRNNSSDKSLKLKNPKTYINSLNGKKVPDKRSKSVNSPLAMGIDSSVRQLHLRTKNVLSKLTAMKTKIPHSTTDTSDEVLPTEEDILKEIHRLQGLLEKVKLNKHEKTSKQPSETKPKEAGKKEDTEKSTKDGEEEESKRRQRPRRERTKKPKKSEERKNWRDVYVSHINEIINKDSKTEDPKIPKFQFGDSLEKFAIKCVEAGLGQIVEAELRVNAKNNHQAFITMDNSSDAMIWSMATRKFAMDGDVVKAFVRNKNEESICDLDETIPLLEEATDIVDEPEAVVVNNVEAPKRDRAFVIQIIKESGNREFVGSIAFKNPSKKDEFEYFKFKARDPKSPIICIPVDSCNEFLKQQESDDILGYLFVAKIINFTEDGLCIGKLVAPVGKRDDLAVEIKAILMHNHLSDVKPFEKQFEDMWMDAMEVQQTDLEVREDLRKECIFTIDPLTARDLDDAVSCTKLNNERYRIGVHISDVSHYLKERSQLDELVKTRATSIYLVNEVIHMLPQNLCMKCSLLPNEDKFTFSVFWDMDKDANVYSTRFSKSIIRSCTQLAYEHAQKIIDNPNETFTEYDFPTICNGFKASDIVERVTILNSLATKMRARRFENGSLSIDKPQFYFNFDPKTGEPTSYEIANRLTANFLIEEFMLLSNQAVALTIFEKFPDIAFLRSHQPPKPSAIRSLKVKLNSVGIDLDMSSSKSIFDGLKKICGASASPEEHSVAMNYLLTKPMMRAKYFCSENVESNIELRHYALAIPIYTHFTSPIRRYPDIIVHRLLSAAMNYAPRPNRTHEELHQLASICNEQKLNAKNAYEESCNLYFKRYISAKKTIIVRAVVVDIFKHCIEVNTIDTGHLIFIPFSIQKVKVDASKAPTAIFISEKKSYRQPVELRLFSSIDVRLKVIDGKLRGFFVSPDVVQRIKNNIENGHTKSDQKSDSSRPKSSSTSKRSYKLQKKKAIRNSRKKSNSTSSGGTDDKKTRRSSSSISHA